MLDPEATYGGSYYNCYNKTYLAVAVVEGGFPGRLGEGASQLPANGWNVTPS